MTFLASAAFTMDPLCIFVITIQDFFSVLLISFSCMNYCLWRLFNFCCCCMNKFFMCTTNYFFSVLRIIFNTSIENYFFVVLIIIFHSIVNLFLGLQCFAGLAVDVDWFESLTSLGDHFENFEVEECFQRECQGETFAGKETKEVFIFLTKSVRSQLSVR